jgi:hypothetical protein
MRTPIHLDGRRASAGPSGPRQLAALAATATLVAALLSGCDAFDEPTIEDRWTRLDFAASNVTPGQIVPAGGNVQVNVNAAITYRSILTGFVVAEMRASSTVTPDMVSLHPDAPRELMAAQIDSLLTNSVSVGRATRAVTGWDHLIQHIDLTFTGSAVRDTSGAAPAGLFVICYLGSGDEIELENGEDSLVVTPFPSAQYEILPVGLELSVGP